MSTNGDLFHYCFQAMASSIALQLVATDAASAQALFNEIEGEVLRIESKYSRYREGSIVSRINRAAGSERVEVDPETSGLFEYVTQLYFESEGLFDVTSGVLRTVWDFGEGKVPSKSQLQAVLPLIGWSKVQWDSPYIKLPLKGMQIDLGGVGKEFACDAAARVCAVHGVKSALLNFGGDLCALGNHPSGRPWTVGISDPNNPSLMIEKAASLTSTCMATSGDYRRSFLLNGKRYSHLLNPQTGFPSGDLRSVTVVAPSCLVAGSLATVAMLKQKQAALQFLDVSGASFLSIDADGEIQHDKRIDSGQSIFTTAVSF